MNSLLILFLILALCEMFLINKYWKKITFRKYFGDLLLRAIVLLIATISNERHINEEDVSWANFSIVGVTYVYSFLNKHGSEIIEKTKKDKDIGELEPM